MLGLHGASRGAALTAPALHKAEQGRGRRLETIGSSGVDGGARWDGAEDLAEEDGDRSVVG